MIEKPQLNLVVLEKTNSGLSVGLRLSFLGKGRIWDCLRDSG